MALTETPICDFGVSAPDFALPATDGRTYSLADIAGPRGTLVMFICNHCPYVLAVIDRLAEDCRALADLGVGSVGIMPNDVKAYPADSFENMAVFAKDHDLPFPYVIDETQSVARAYGAVCTPDFFGYDAKFGLQYRGRLDSAKMGDPPQNAPRELLEGMTLVANTGQGPDQQIPSMGCSIKWRAA